MPDAPVLAVYPHHPVHRDLQAPFRMSPPVAAVQLVAVLGAAADGLPSPRVAKEFTEGLRPMPDAPLLAPPRLDAFYRDLQALFRVSPTVAAGQLVAVTGAPAHGLRSPRVATKNCMGIAADA